jgi:hypothetical protein
MALTWSLIEDAADRDRAWDEVVESCGYATFFHTRAWAELFVSTLKTWQPDPVAIEFSDGNMVVLPLMRRLDSEHRQSTVPGMYGGPLFLREPGEEHLDEFDKVPLWYQDVFLVDNPYSPYGWDPNGLVKWRLYTHITDLSPGFDGVLGGFRTNIRRDILKAEESALEIRLASTADHARAYFEIYEAAIGRFGDNLQSFYPVELFENLLRMPAYGEAARLSLAYVEGRPVSGLIVLCQGQIAVGWHWSTHPEHLASHACPLLLATSMRRACDDGFRWFDFLCSGSLTGVAHFKDGFGSRRKPYNVYWSPGMSPDETRPDTGAGAALRRVQQQRAGQETRA